VRPILFSLTTVILPAYCGEKWELSLPRFFKRGLIVGITSGRSHAKRLAMARPFCVPVLCGRTGECRWLVQQAARFPEVGFRIAGTGEEESAIKNLTAKLDCKNVDLLGHLSQPQLGQQMRRADIFFFPSILEGYPPGSVAG